MMGVRYPPRPAPVFDLRMVLGAAEITGVRDACRPQPKAGLATGDIIITFRRGRQVDGPLGQAVCRRGAALWLLYLWP